MREGLGLAPVAGRRDLVHDSEQVADREAEFARLVLSHQPEMARVIWRVVRDPDLAEDALQEALTKLWRRLSVVAEHPNPEALVLRVCLDAACDQLRAHLRRRRRTLPLDGGGAVEPVVEGGRPGDPAVLDAVRRAIGRLERRQATAILLRAFRGASYETIARVLGCSEVTARVHVMRARKKLRRWLSPLHHLSTQEPV